MSKKKPKAVKPWLVIAIPFGRSFAAFGKKLEDKLNELGGNYTITRQDFKTGILLICHRVDPAQNPLELLRQRGEQQQPDGYRVSLETSQLLDGMLEVVNAKPGIDTHKQAVEILSSVRPPMTIEMARKIMQECDGLGEFHMKNKDHPDDAPCSLELVTGALSKACKEFVAARLS
jgi:hypothetical protein